MKMTTEDYNAIVDGFERLEPSAIKEYGSLDKYYEAVWLHACKVGKNPKVRYIWDCFCNARINITTDGHEVFIISMYPLPGIPYYNIITDNKYSDSQLETAIKRYLKSKGFDYYDK